MKRIDLLNAIEGLKGSENIEHAIEELKYIAGDFCSHYETEFINIAYNLRDLAPHIDIINDSLKIAERCESDLY